VESASVAILSTPDRRWRPANRLGKGLQRACHEENTMLSCGYSDLDFVIGV
jgi:hypothetical protein